MKRISAILLTLVLLLAMCTSALATEDTSTDNPPTGTITISNAVNGQEYSIYRILDLKMDNVNLENNALFYTWNNAWKEFITTAEYTDGVKFFEVDEVSGIVLWNKQIPDTKKEKEAAAALLAEKALVYATENADDVKAVSGTAGKNGISFNGLTLGYYLVDSSVGALCALNTTTMSNGHISVNITDKNQPPVIGKKVEEDSAVENKETDPYFQTNDADIGQTINFKSTVTLGDGAANQKYWFHDVMSEGLTYTGVTGVTKKGVALTEGTDYEVLPAGATLPGGYTCDKACDFHIIFSKEFNKNAAVGDVIVINYTGELNEKANVGSKGNPNEAYISYGEKGDITSIKVEIPDTPDPDNPPPTETYTYTWEFSVYKYTGDLANEEDIALAGAEFSLTKNPDGKTGLMSFVYDAAEGFYRVVKADAKDAKTVLTTGSNGRITIKGLDSDVYYLAETKAPAGYNRSEAIEKITIMNNDTVEQLIEGKNVRLENKTVNVSNEGGSEMPSTGGVGTKMFYTVGMLMMAAAVALLVTKKRMSYKAD